jgi:TetR/AcrR family transcriptional repressor of nem operon
MASTSRPIESGSTREQIVGVARDLIQTRSYLGFSFQDVADQVGIRKASLYHHFPTKEALGVEVLHSAREGFRAWSEYRARTPEEAIDSYFRMLRNSLHAGDGVCPTGALAPGWGVINDELRQAVRELRSAHVLWLTGVLGGLPQPANGKKSPAVAARAAYVFAVCQGALLASRMTGRVEDFDEATVQLKVDLLD